MIGIFDSGVGGMCALREVRALLPQSDIVYLADRKNAPYGTKTKEELINLVRQDIRRLREMGAEDILVACCTASTVIPCLEKEDVCGVLPIIYPTAKIATNFKKVTVIATNHTAQSGAFGRAIHALSADAAVEEIPCQRLVALVESGDRDGHVSEECAKFLKEIARRVRAHSSEGLILGCTHFSHLEKTIKNLLPEVEIISPAKIGARELALRVLMPTEGGKTIYTE